MRILVAVVLLGAMCAPALAGKKANFINGTFATADGCKKLDALAAGAARNVGTVPETLTADGFQSWEGGCTFTSIKQKVKGRKWVARMACGEAAEEHTETDTFVRLDDGRLKVTVEGKATIFERCKTKEAK